jgi:hypothetical protein
VLASRIIASFTCKGTIQVEFGEGLEGSAFTAAAERLAIRFVSTAPFCMLLAHGPQSNTESGAVLRSTEFCM